MSAKHVYLIDGSGYIFRGYHALPPLTRPDGTPIGAVLGFCNMILKLLESEDIDYIGVIFDCARENFRHQIYPDYKANREDPPEDLIPQFQLIRDACEAFNLPAIELKGYEADDVIATFAKQALDQGATVTVVSGDKDLMQLIRPGVAMLDPIKNAPISETDVLKKFGVKPEKVIDVQSLAGDSTDNIPGVPGIGVKTAATLLEEFGDLETLLEQAHTITQPKRRQTLVENADKARLSKKLVTLAQDVPLEMDLKALSLEAPQTTKLLPFLEEQGFRNLITRLTKKGILKSADDCQIAHTNGTEEAGGQDKKTIALTPHSSIKITEALSKLEATYKRVESLEQLQDLLKAASLAGVVAFDTETTSLNLQEADLVGFSLCFKAGEAYYVPLAHKDTSIPQPNFQKALELLKPFLEHPGHLIVGQNIKYDMRVMLRYGIEIAAYEDTMAMSYALDSTQHSHGLDFLAHHYFDHKMISYAEVMQETGIKNALFCDVLIEKATVYGAEDADFTYRLYKVLIARLKEERVNEIYYNFDRPMVKILALMEACGILVSGTALKNISQDFDQKMQILEKEIYELAGRKFTIGSPKQLGEVLFEDLGLKSGKKGKSGTLSTSASVLEDLAAEGHILPEKIIAWRQFAKLKSTYADALEEHRDPTTHRVHTNYGLTITTTGRLSSSDPNLQNIPVRTEEGRLIRAAFVPEENFKLVSLDYSQIELRLLAHMAEIPSLISAFKEGQDIHAKTASEVFGMDLKNPDPNLRRAAKAVNFGIIYGISPYGLARQLKIPTGEAKEIIERYFKCYPGIGHFMESQKEDARRTGFVKTLFGRTLHIPHINDKNFARRGHAERQAINAPLQGSQADIIKRAMTFVPEILEHFNNTNLTKANASNTTLPLPQSGKSQKTTTSQFDLFESPVSSFDAASSQPHQEHPLKTNKTQDPYLFEASPFKWLPKLTGDKARLLLQVHDELVFELHEEIVDTASLRLKRMMQSVVKLDLPLIVDIGIGANWNEAH